MERPITPAPMTRICFAIVSGSDAPAKRILLIQQQRPFAIDECRAGDRGEDPVALMTKARCERAAQDALLDPLLVFEKFSVGGEAGEFGAGSGAAGGTVVGLTRAEDEIS